MSDEKEPVLARLFVIELYGARKGRLKIALASQPVDVDNLIELWVQVQQLRHVLGLPEDEIDDC